MPKLYILCGAPGSGKSTWAKKERWKEFYPNSNVKYVSRDEVRFSILEKDEAYFAHETDVFKIFTSDIAAWLCEGYDVIADATHINKSSRHKLCKAIDEIISDYEIVYVVFNVDYRTCTIRNAVRVGRYEVPNIAIFNMIERFEAPSLNEDPRAIRVIDGTIPERNTKE